MDNKKRETERERRARERLYEKKPITQETAYLYYICEQHQHTYKWGIATRYPTLISI